jgi:hypothetical protein
MKPPHVVVTVPWAGRALAWSALMAITGRACGTAAGPRGKCRSRTRTEYTRCLSASCWRCTSGRRRRARTFPGSIMRRRSRHHVQTLIAPRSSGAIKLSCELAPCPFPQADALVSLPYRIPEMMS